MRTQPLTAGLVVALLLLGLPGPTVHAATVADLYAATVPVADTSEAARATAVRAAMRVVLVKLTGDSSAAARDGRSVVRAAPSMLQQFQYLDADEGLTLRASFDPAALDTALADAGLALWSRERPEIVAWLAVDDGGEQTMVSRGELGGYADSVRERASLRGVPVTLPLLDAVDAEQLRAVGTGPSENVLLASERYGADAVLIGAVRVTPIGIWEGSWTLHFDDETTTWQTQGELPRIVIDEGIDGVADRLAARYARAAGARSDAVADLRVVDVADVDDYARVQRYLESLHGTTSVVPSVVSTGQIIFRVTVRGGAEALDQAIALGDVLQAVEPGLDGSGSYRVLPR